MVARRSNRSKKPTREVQEEENSLSEDEIEKLVEEGNEKDDDDSEGEVSSGDEMDETNGGVDDEEESSDEDGEEGGEDEDSDSEEEGDDDDDEDAPDSEPVTIKPLPSATGEQCTFDLLNLLALNSHQVEIVRLYAQKTKTTEDEKVTIPGEAMPVEINEELLLEKATDGCTQLIHALWQLPTERSDAGPLIVLPGFSETKLPRQLVCMSFQCIMFLPFASTAL